MKLRLSALLLAAVLLLTAPAAAASNTTANFVREKAYTGQFSDLATASAFYDNVAALYEYGLSVGKADGTFGLTDSVTLGQILIFAGRIRSLYRTGDPEYGVEPYRTSGGEMADAYLRYLQEEGVVGADFGTPFSAFATRAQVAHVLSGTLPSEVLLPMNDAVVTEGYATRRFITDVTEYTPYYQDILFLYRCGISLGSDAYGSFQPDAPITRGAAAAMLTRMVDPSLRVKPDWNLTTYSSAAGTTLSSLVTPGTLVSAPSTSAEMDESVRYMLSSGDSTLSLHYASVTSVSARSKMEEALSIVKSYCEQGYNTVSCTYLSSGDLRLSFSAAGTGGRTEEYRTATMEFAAAVHDELWSTGQLTADMTQTEMARVYYTWICNNCVYDYSATNTSLSHIPYSLFADGTAVCDGYTGAYNLLLKLEGIKCTALSNEGHIWTVATLDGTQCHIDTTWGDSGRTISYDYFGMTPEQSWREHPW
ncbi:S-layer homology domain-containing protein [Oscillibacter sp.]|uniref:S-layer homology domain-containing protein n=1 Tax=Oscillibacter sp. TaxID=1945593 RepID=UPI002610FBDC|nr:S-layer homology domain-containing protein [Oscillibacter sp.]MDD3346166.1 S-layer homology domain-containing protein [Oscillibacter sp.]